jgi:hypothetical protein
VKSRAVEPRALRTASDESQSNTPYSRASAESSIMPIRKK